MADSDVEERLMNSDPQPAAAYSDEPEPTWRWKNCRSLGLKFDLWLWPWAIGAHRTEDVYGGERWVYLGPVSLGIAYNIGNSSSYGLDRFTALSEAEAYERARK